MKDHKQTSKAFIEQLINNCVSDIYAKLNHDIAMYKLNNPNTLFPKLRKTF